MPRITPAIAAKERTSQVVLRDVERRGAAAEPRLAGDLRAAAALARGLAAGLVPEVCRPRDAINERASRRRGGLRCGRAGCERSPRRPHEADDERSLANPRDARRRRWGGGEDKCNRVIRARRTSS